MPLQTVIVLLIAGIGLVCSGLLHHRDRKRLFRKGRKVTGVILQINDKGDDCYEAEISFETADCQKKLIRYNLTDLHNYTVGQLLNVVYDPGNPERTLVDEGAYKPNGSGSFYAGLVLIMISFIVLMTVLR
ncbi:DUF3592 domain-containing protein [Mucilaginibacter paludis]|uniref:DUF3592 domain-containing protein n=1 Tax=Mucilaginibacter paludis DSM 18603 TaxID=714943 RepID=H1YGH8_9SPHI|nr:DUF3592 domain-containing protein [Mucilaginibacter paludis]EHQ24530.1 hypothetical protein Mucpa_0334 [Mucilaginibacter paludis DSM 18603]